MPSPKSDWDLCRQKWNIGVYVNQAALPPWISGNTYVAISWKRWILFWLVAILANFFFLSFKMFYIRKSKVSGFTLPINVFVRSFKWANWCCILATCPCMVCMVDSTLWMSFCMSYVSARTVCISCRKVSNSQRNWFSWSITSITCPWINIYIQLQVYDHVICW